MYRDKKPSGGGLKYVKTRSLSMISVNKEWLFNKNLLTLYSNRSLK